jgi:predicted membrane-bound mannosyltransferase/DNA-binding beta-propeller fold protein YncE/Ca2+/Na+ antiporter
MATIESPERQSPPSAYTTFNRALSNVYALNWEMIAYTIVFIVALFTRFWDLGARVMSHDESLHTYYSWQLFDRGDFDHTPLMHGPLLFHMTAFSYFLFGVNDFAGRAYVAALGVAIVLFPILLRRWLGKVGSLMASIGFLISPMILYYSRYVRHDIPTIFFALVIIYAILQYVDGEAPRRPIWLAVTGAAMSLMLASKEVAFMYVAIVGSFFTLYWLLRLLQGFTYSPTESVEKKTHSRTAELVYEISGQVLSVVVAGVVGYLIGSLIWEFWLPARNPAPIPRIVLQFGSAAIVFLLFQLVGVIPMTVRGEFRNVGHMFANGLRNTRSAMMLIVAGFILGAIVALIMFTVLDIIKPENIWMEVSYSEQVNDKALELFPNDPTQQQTYLSERLPGQGEKLGATALDFQDNLFQSAVTWMGIPILLIVFGVMLIAILKSPRGLFSWQDLMIILLLAFMVSGIFLVAERRSIHSHDLHAVEERMEENHNRKQDILQERLGADFVATPFRVEETNNLIIYATWFVLGLLTIVVLATRVLTDAWDYLNRQPIFDMLIVMGTMIFPWLAAVPLFLAGYDLDQVPLGPQTRDAAIIVSIPFFLFVTAVGMSWNWKYWPVAAVAFWLPFAVFFTTFFTNGNGLGTGVIGSLGYWLEQQGVRRGSQPQYYYTLVQVPVYEYLPLILASIAGLFGISKFWDFRATDMKLKNDDIYAEDFDIEIVDDEYYEDDETLDADVDSEALTAALNRRELLDFQEQITEEENRPRWAQEYNHTIEVAMRANYREYLGAIPFLQFVGYWAVFMFIALTLAGEKMPWLTSHITVPLILIGGWYMGRVVEKINLNTLRESGWLLIVVIIPVFVVALVELGLPYFTGENLPFRGNGQVELENTGQWLAALFGVIVTGYFMARVAMRVGAAQARRIIFSALVLILALVTARHAWLASFTNYDYATEFLVYAHAGPAVKTVMDDLDYLADRYPEGNDIPIVYDEESTWPFVWYLRDYDNLTYVTKESVKSNPGQLDGATVVIVGEQKNADVEAILGDDYYKFDYIRLWWPMQEYFNLNYDRVAGVFSDTTVEPASSMFRRGMWDIWWERDYQVYGEAMCVDQRVSRCSNAGSEDSASTEPYDATCVAEVRNECANEEQRFRVEDWPVRDKLFVYIHKDFAVQIWDSGLDGQSVSERLVPDPENAVQTTYNPTNTFGGNILRPDQGSDSLNNPRGISTDASGNAYVVDTNNSRVAVFDSAGNFMSFIGENLLNEPWGIAVSPADGNIYVADTWNHRVAVFNPAGELIQTYGQFGRPEDATYNDPPTMFGPRNVTVDLEGYVYVADTGGHRVRIYDQEFNHIRDIGGRGSERGQMLEPVGIAVHPITGEIYVAETWNQRISVYSREGAPIRSWDVNMWLGTTNSAQRPYLTISPDGTMILVSDMDSTDANNGPRVVAYDLSGQPVTSFNAEPGSPSYVQVVSGIDFAPDGRLFVVDSSSSRVVVFPPLPVNGSIPPIPNPNYGLGTGGDTENDTSGGGIDSVPPPIEADDQDTSANADALAQMQIVGSAYWQTLATGNYAGYVALHCQEQRSTLESEEAFINTVSQPYLNASLAELVINAELTDTGVGMVTWEGNLVIEPSTANEYRITAAQISPLRLENISGQWQICKRDVFRPGGA